MNISSRLKTIGNLVDDNSFLIDVGCDHAFLDIYVVKQKPTVKAIASDISEGPLKQAKTNIKKFGLSKKINTLLSNGIEKLPKMVDTLVISGMGGKNMLGIVKYQPDKLKQIETIIISPNTDADIIRTFLCNNGYYLVHEEIIQDSNFFYPIIKFKKGKVRYNKKELFFGPLLLKNKSDIFVSYLEKILIKKEQIYKFLPNNYYIRKWQLRREIKFIKNYLKD